MTTTDVGPGVPAEPLFAEPAADPSREEAPAIGPGVEPEPRPEPVGGGQAGSQEPTETVPADDLEPEVLGRVHPFA
ncbi:MAG TPA: hypothetical protein VF763_03175 [Candidatus Limnocylindrales bacterium]